MGIIKTASDIMGVLPENTLTLIDKVHVGKTGVNYLFKLTNPKLEVGKVYDFNFNIDRRKALRVSFTEEGNGEFALFGTYKNDKRIVSEGFYKYLLHQDNISLVLRIVITDKVDFEFLDKALFEVVVRGLDISEPLTYTGTDIRDANIVFGEPDE